MRKNYRYSALAAEIIAVTTLCAGPALAVENKALESCQALATQFKTADVSHVSAERLEAAKRQAVYGERLCGSDPGNGVKAIALALADIGVTTH
jgi:hypothetical protein